MDAKWGFEGAADETDDEKLDLTLRLGLHKSDDDNNNRAAPVAVCRVGPFRKGTRAAPSFTPYYCPKGLLNVDSMSRHYPQPGREHMLRHFLAPPTCLNGRSSCCMETPSPSSTRLYAQDVMPLAVAGPIRCDNGFDNDTDLRSSLMMTRGLESNNRQGGCRSPTKRCLNPRCNTAETPVWRRGPLGSKTLCNACGIRYRREKERHQARREMQLQLSPAVKTATWRTSGPLSSFSDSVISSVLPMEGSISR